MPDLRPPADVDLRLVRYLTALAGLEEFDCDHAGGLKREVIAHLGTLDSSPPKTTWCSSALPRLQGVPWQRRRHSRRLDAAGAGPEHPHGMADAEFDALFTNSRPVIFAFHGCAVPRRRSGTEVDTPWRRNPAWRRFGTGACSAARRPRDGRWQICPGIGRLRGYGRPVAAMPTTAPSRAGMPRKPSSAFVIFQPREAAAGARPASAWADMGEPQSDYRSDDRRENVGDYNSACALPAVTGDHRGRGRGLFERCPCEPVGR
jgi:XFP C-terminal domain